MMYTLLQTKEEYYSQQCKRSRVELIGVIGSYIVIARCLDRLEDAVRASWNGRRNTDTDGGAKHRKYEALPGTRQTQVRCKRARNLGVPN